MKPHKHSSFIVGIFLVTCNAFADTLSLKEFIRSACKQNPQQKIAASTVASKRASVESSRSSLLPQVNGTAGISSSQSPGQTLQNGGTGIMNSTSIGIHADALLYDFGASPFRYKASGRALAAAQFDSLSAMASLILSAKTAYFNYLLSQKLLAVNEDAMKQANLHLDQATILFKVGKTAQIEVTKARVEVANAEVNIIHAKNAVDLAKVQMEVIAGALLGDPLVLTDSLGALEIASTLEEALKAALQKRPEINSLLTDVESAKLLLKAARATYLPSLNANGDVGWGRKEIAAVRAPDFSNAPNWSVGVELSVPIYQGGRISAAVQQADIALRLAEAQLEAKQLTVSQEVKQFFLQEKEALQRIGATKTLIEQAQQSLTLSQERFRAGVAFSLEITDAEVTLADARAKNAQALFDYRIAHANLLLAIGSLNE
jgi:TolC family type I secretion outer membrane protein